MTINNISTKAIQAILANNITVKHYARNFSIKFHLIKMIYIIKLCK